VRLSRIEQRQRNVVGARAPPAAYPPSAYSAGQRRRRVDRVNERRNFLEAIGAPLPGPMDMEVEILDL